MRYYDLKDLMTDQEINKALLDASLNLGSEELLNTIKTKSSIIREQIFAEVHSTNTIEGVIVKDAKEVFKQSRDIVERTEKEWIGVKLAFQFINDNFKELRLSLENIKKIHAILLNGSNDEIAGKFKVEENFVSQYDEKGKFVKAITTSLPENTQSDLEKAIETYLNNIELNPQYKFVSAILFIGEFLAIHPFKDGNGRMSRLMLIWLLRRNGVNLLANISLTKYINETKWDYYNALDYATEGMTNNSFDKQYIKPFVIYYLNIINKAYQEWKTLAKPEKENKRDQIIELVNSQNNYFARKDIKDYLPRIDATYISKLLEELVKAKKLEKIGDKKSTKYKKK